MSQQKGSTYKIILVAYLRCEDMVGKNIWQYPSQIQNKGLEGFWLTNKKSSLQGIFSLLQYE